MSKLSFVRIIAAAALIAVPSLAMAEPDHNSNGRNNNGCANGQVWSNGQCVNGNWNNNSNGNWNNGRQRNRDRDDNNGNRQDNGRHNGWNNPNNPHNGYGNNGYGNNGYGNNGYGNNGYGNNGYGNNGYGNNGYGNGGYGNRGGQLTGTVSSFSPYNLYLSNGLHVVLHDGTVINPTGTNLTGGQRVRIIGNRNADGTFAASEIDVIGNGYGR